MRTWTTAQIEAMFTPECRWVEDEAGCLRPIYLPAVNWICYDELLDAGFKHEALIAYASPVNWPTPEATFEMRFGSAIALTHRVRLQERSG